MREIDPRRQQDRRPEFRAVVEPQRFDLGVRVQEMRQQTHGQVGAGGVAGDDDVFGRAVKGRDGVAEEGDGLLELARVGGLRGEGVGEHEGGDGGRGERGDKGEVAEFGGDVVAATLGRSGKAEGRKGGCGCLTVEVEYHFLGGRVTEPVRFCAVQKRDIFGVETLLLGECWIKIIKIRSEVPIPMISAVCLF